MMDSNGVKTKWAYDALHRVVAKQYADTSGESCDYTRYGELNSATNGRGATTTFGYSGYGELTNVTYPNPSITPNVALSYNPLGRESSMSDGLGTSSWSYDGVGRLTSESGPFGNDSISYAYDSLERIQSLSIARDATTSDTQSFAFDGLGRLSSLTAGAGSFGNVGTFNYGYVGNTDILARMDRPNGTSTLLSYENLQDPNSLHRLTGVQDVNTASGANTAGFSYGYDGPSVQNGFRDNRTSQTRAYGSEAAQTISYGYNPTSMLQGEGAPQGGASTPALSKSYAFDAMGNRTGFTDAVAKTQVTSTYNNLNQLTSTSNYDTSSGQAVATGSSSFGYDGDGNMNAVASKDASGAVTSQTGYSYDDASRLIGITAQDGSKWQFVYDGASRLRISRQLDKTGALVPGSEKRRVYLGMDVVQERDANNSVTASYSGGLSARSTASGTVFYGFDGNGSVTSLTDETGAVVGSYTYDAWGNITASSGAKAQENPYRYSGKEQLAGYYSYGFRFYNSGLGRWINRDPIEEDGGTNLYGMVEDNPTNYVDDCGLSPFDPLKPPVPNVVVSDPATGWAVKHYYPSQAAHGWHLHLVKGNWIISIGRDGKPINKVGQGMWDRLSGSERKQASGFLKQNSAKIGCSTDELKEWVEWKQAAARRGGFIRFGRRGVGASAGLEGDEVGGFLGKTGRFLGKAGRFLGPMGDILGSPIWGPWYLPPRDGRPWSEHPAA